MDGQLPPPKHPTQSAFDFFTGRDVTIHVPKSMERRLLAMEDRLLATDPTATPQGEDWEETIVIMIGSCIDRGLDEGERDDGLEADIYGNLTERPKRKLKRRVKAALKELRR